MRRTKQERSSSKHPTEHDLDYRDYIGAVRRSVKELPAGFPAYCIYIPTGMNHDFEIKVLARLIEWGNTMGNNQLVADWDVGDESYLYLARKLEIKKMPSIVLTDFHNPNKDNFVIVF